MLSHHEVIVGIGTSMKHGMMMNKMEKYRMLKDFLTIERMHEAH